jgi:hypothetical protein
MKIAQVAPLFESPAEAPRRDGAHRYRSGDWVFAGIVSNVLTCAGGGLRNGRCCCSRTLAQFVPPRLPITCLISPGPSIVHSSMAGVAGKKGQDGCHEYDRKGMISSSFPHIAGCLRAGVIGTRSICPHLLCRRRNSILCRLKRTSSIAGISRWRVAHCELPCMSEKRPDCPGCPAAPAHSNEKLLQARETATSTVRLMGRLSGPRIRSPSAPAHISFCSSCDDHCCHER